MILLIVIAGCRSPEPQVAAKSPCELLIEKLALRQDVKRSVIELRRSLPASRACLERHKDSPDALLRNICRGLLANPVSDYEWFLASGRPALDLQVERWNRWLHESGCGNARMDAGMGLGTLERLSSPRSGFYDPKHHRFLLHGNKEDRFWPEVIPRCSDGMARWSPRLRTRMRRWEGPQAFEDLIRFAYEVGGDLVMKSRTLEVMTKEEAFESCWYSDARPAFRPDIKEAPVNFLLDMLIAGEFIMVPESGEVINLFESEDKKESSRETD